MASSSSQTLEGIQTCCFALLDLPFELRNKILILSVIEPDGVHPRERDNALGTFTYTYANRFNAWKYDTEEPLMATQLGFTCKQLFKEVIEANLFYKHNQFRFMDPAICHTYLRQITLPRMMSIQSIFLEVDDIHNPTQAFNLFSICKGLKHLRINFDNNNIRPAFIGRDSLLRIRGLESFAIVKIPKLNGYIEGGRAGSPSNMALLVEAKGLRGDYHIADLKREVLRPRTEEDDRKAEEAVANDCYCSESLLLPTEGEVLGCNCKDPAYQLALEKDREYWGDDSWGNPYWWAVDLDMDFPEDTTCQCFVDDFDIPMKGAVVRREAVRLGMDWILEMEN